jgi:hypothetical protein
MSWRLSIGMETEVSCTGKDHCFRKFIQYGKGYSLKPTANVLLYALALADIGSTNQDGQTFHGGPGAMAGVTWSPNDNLKLALYGNYLMHFGKRNVSDWKSGIEASYLFPADYEVRLRGILFTDDKQANISLAKYF